jgi:hypothetical protein
MIKWLKEEGYPITTNFILEASSGGQVELLYYLIKENPNLQSEIAGDPEIRQRIFETAVKVCPLIFVKWLYDTFSFSKLPSPDDLSYAAAYGGNLQVLEFLDAKGFSFGDDIYCGAIYGGNLHVVRWLYELDYPWSDEIFEMAVGNINVEGLKWIRDRGCPWDEGAYIAAIEANDFEKLKWLRDQGCPWDEDACFKAACEGKFDILRWLYDNGCPRDDTEMCLAAAAAGDIGILNWLREQGCKWNSNTCKRAAQYRNLDLLTWAFENGCPIRDHEIFLAALTCGDLDTLKWAKKHLTLNETTVLHMWHSRSPTGVRVLAWLKEPALFLPKHFPLIAKHTNCPNEILAWLLENVQPLTRSIPLLSRHRLMSMYSLRGWDKKNKLCRKERKK